MYTNLSRFINRPTKSTYNTTDRYNGDYVTNTSRQSQNVTPVKILRKLMQSYNRNYIYIVGNKYELFTLQYTKSAIQLFLGNIQGLNGTWEQLHITPTQVAWWVNVRQIEMYFISLFHCIFPNLCKIWTR